MFAFLDKARSVAPAGYNRWRILPAALCIHLCIGQAYAWSVFNIPLTRLVGIQASVAEDWTREEVIWIFSLAIVFLGLSAAVGGTWLERVGPRCAMFVSASCFASGFFISALGAHLHSIFLLYLGYGVFGGCGLGIGYISPVSTLIKWFPDRPGLATGLAIMGFGGGAMLGAPLAVHLMDFFSTEASTGVVATFMIMGSLYLGVMLTGAFLVRLPPEGWQPSSLAARSDRRARGKVQPVHADQALRTTQFYLLWSMLFINVTAGIGILGKASDMLQDMFPTTVATGSWFVGLLSMANMLGRILWSSASDYLGRRRTYAIFFGLGATLYATLPHFSQTESPWLFMLTCGLIMTMYGGAFATIPAYLRDLFGTMHVGAIHGRLLTAWSLAGVAGPVLLTRWAEHHKQMGGPASESYRGVLLFMAGLLLLGLAANAALYPVSSCHHYREVD